MKRVTARKKFLPLFKKFKNDYSEPEQKQREILGVKWKEWKEISIHNNEKFGLLDTSSSVKLYSYRIAVSSQEYTL